MITVHAPHCPSPQPNFGPFSARSSLNTYKRGVAGSTSTVCARPLTFRAMVAMTCSQPYDERRTRERRIARVTAAGDTHAQPPRVRPAHLRSGGQPQIEPPIAFGPPHLDPHPFAPLVVETRAIVFVQRKRAVGAGVDLQAQRFVHLFTGVLLHR